MQTNSACPWRDFGKASDPIRTLPEDLRGWLSECDLVRLLYEALHSVEEENSPHLETMPLPAGAPRVILTLLTYCYSTGLYSSEEIERCIPLDRQLLYLSTKDSPSSSALRQFRRHHRRLLQRTLSRLLRLASARHAVMTAPFSANGMINDSCGDAVSCEREAELRVDQAILADTMALDV